MNEPADWYCEGCGDRVYQFGGRGVPPHRFCCVCLWLCEHIDDPADFDAIYRRMRQGMEAALWDGA